VLRKVVKLSQEPSPSSEKCVSIKVLYDVKNMVKGYLERDLPESAKEVLRRTVDNLDKLPVCE
jgi:hypothetical protein